MEVQALAVLGLYGFFHKFYTSTISSPQIWLCLFPNQNHRFAFVGSHENIVGYYTSWFENEKLYIQMELCDHSLSIKRSSHLFTEGEVLEPMHKVDMYFFKDTYVTPMS